MTSIALNLLTTQPYFFVTLGLFFLSLSSFAFGNLKIPTVPFRAYFSPTSVEAHFHTPALREWINWQGTALSFSYAARLCPFIFLFPFPTECWMAVRMLRMEIYARECWFSFWVFFPSSSSANSVNGDLCFSSLILLSIVFVKRKSIRRKRGIVS